MTIKAILESIISEQCPDDEIALHLSGGVDSCCLGFCAEELGKKVSAYCFRIKDKPNPDSIGAEHIAKEMGWEFKLTELPDDLETLITDIQILATFYDCEKKTQFECTWPFIYIYPEIKEKYILSGLGADSHYGLSRASHTKFKSRHSKENFDKYRYDYFSQENPGGYLQQLTLAKEYNKKFVVPFIEKSVFNHFIQFDWHQINKPYEKHMIISQYSYQFSLMNVRKHANLQLISGVSNHFEKILESSLNQRRRIRVMDILRDVYNRYGNQSQLSLL